jgi:hypothetical protein
MSASSIESHQVTREVERAYESQKRFIPILIDISHEDFITSQPIWREVIGTQTSISIPPDDIDAVIPRVIKGLEWIGIYPKAEPGSPTTDTERQKHDKAGYRYGPRSLDGRVAVSGERVFVFGYKPAAKKLYGRGATAEECTKQLVDGRAEFLCIHGPGGIGKIPRQSSCT